MPVIFFTAEWAYQISLPIHILMHICFHFEVKTECLCIRLYSFLRLDVAIILFHKGKQPRMEWLGHVLVIC